MRRIVALLARLLSAAQHNLSGKGSGGYGLAVVVPNDLESIASATRQAHETLDGFIERLSAPEFGQSDFSVKILLHDGEERHYLWLHNLSYEDSYFQGTLGPDAAGMKDHVTGEQVEAARSEVEDWMYVERGKLVGGFSLRAIRDRLSPNDRKRFERSLWFAFE